MNIISRTKKIPDGACWLCVADLHLHHLPAWRLDWCYDFADDLIDYLETTDLRLVLLGDVLELKDKVDARVANILIYILGHAPNLCVWVTGQHDSFTPGQATFYELSALPKVKICDDKTLHIPVGGGPDVWFVPFARSRERYRELLGNVPDGDAVFTHLPIAEALRGFGAEVPEDAITVADFERFAWVYSGDIHKHNRFKNFEYIGATSQRDWRDEGVAGCVGVVTIDGKLTRVPVAHPIHRRITKQTELKKISKAPEILKVDGIDVSDAQLDALRSRTNVIEVAWVPPPIEALVKKHGIEDAGERDPKLLIAEYLDSITLPDGHVSKKDLSDYATTDVMGALGYADTD